MKDATPYVLSNLLAIEETMLSVFVRAATFLYQSGYTERAIAMFQALLEFNFFKPTEQLGTFESQIHSFEMFWDRDIPRVGEPGAPTWRIWYEQYYKVNKPFPFNNSHVLNVNPLPPSTSANSSSL